MWLVIMVVQTRDAVQRQQQQIQQQDDQISELNDLLDEKQQFGAAMGDFLDTARALDGAPMAALVPMDEAQGLAHAAWTSRRVGSAVASHTTRVRELTESVRAAQLAADLERASNTTGTVSEQLLDEIGSGYARLDLGGADDLCRADVVGCVSSDDPYVVHLDPQNLSHPSMDDWSRRFVTYHEFAHVLQFTNPVATEAVQAAFEGDVEFMADCYALRQLDAWSLSRRVWETSSTYWESELGYGRVCDTAQRQVIDDWLSQIGVRLGPISQ